MLLLLLPLPTLPLLLLRGVWGGNGDDTDVLEEEEEEDEEEEKEEEELSLLLVDEASVGPDGADAEDGDVAVDVVGCCGATWVTMGGGVVTTRGWEMGPPS